jgi:hypothetical protein
LKSLKLLAVKSDDENAIKARNQLTHSQNWINIFITDTYINFDHFDWKRPFLWFFSWRPKFSINLSIGSLSASAEGNRANWIVDTIQFDYRPFTSVFYPAASSVTHQCWCCILLNCNPSLESGHLYGQVLGVPFATSVLRLVLRTSSPRDLPGNRLRIWC